MKKITAVILCLAMLLSLSACSFFDNKLIKAIKATAALESLHAELTAEGVVSANLDGSGFEQKSLDVTFTAGADADIIASPLCFRADAAILENDLVPTELLPYVTVYGERADSKSVNVYYGSGDSFKGYNLSISDGSFDMSKLLKLLGTGSKLFKEAGSEKINGTEAVRYDGVFSEEFISSLLALAGKSDIKIEGDVPVSLWIDAESYHILRLDADLSGICESLSAFVSDVAKLDIGAFGLSFGFSFAELKLSVELSGFNAIEEIDVPAPIAYAKEQAA